LGGFFSFVIGTGAKRQTNSVKRRQDDEGHWHSGRHQTTQLKPLNQYWATFSLGYTKPPIVRIAYRSPMFNYDKFPKPSGLLPNNGNELKNSGRLASQPLMPNRRFKFCAAAYHYLKDMKNLFGERTSKNENRNTILKFNSCN